MTLARHCAKTRTCILHIVLLSVMGATPAIAQSDCPGSGAEVIVQTDVRQLILCDSGKEVQRYPVAVGRGGVGKSTQGDGKTPIGRFPLGEARASHRFHRFVPIGYPTPEQKAKGYSGQDVGIHGPARFYRHAGRLNTLLNWTQGCIAVGSDQEIDDICDWVGQRQARFITLLRTVPRSSSVNLESERK